MNDWDKHLGMVQFAINNAWQEFVQETPFFLNFGKHPRTVLTHGVPANGTGKRKGNSPGQPTKNPASGEFVQKMQSILARAKQCMLAAQQRQKRYYDKYHKFQEHGIGEQVLLSTENLQLKTAGTAKLLPRWVGPFTVTDRIGSVAYKLGLPPCMSKLHPVFHVGLLRQYGDNGTTQPTPPPELIDDELEYTVETILDHREVRRGKQRKIQYLVK